MQWLRPRLINDAKQLGLPAPTKSQRYLTNLLALSSILIGAWMSAKEAFAFTEGEPIQVVRAIMAFVTLVVIPRALKHSGKCRTRSRS